MVGLDTIFRGKKITQVGLGLLGRGVGDAAFLAEHGADLLVTDLKTPEELAPSLRELKRFPDIAFRLGAHYGADVVGRDLVLKGAGVPYDAECIAEARRAGVPVDMSASLFARIADIPLVGVTGTRGKSTVTHLLHAILTADGRRALLGGNVRGVSNLALLEQVTHDSVGVFELDSWQCQGFAEEHSLDVPGVRQGPLSPSVAVFTSFMPDHMTYYRGDMDRYLADKAQIFLHQDEGDILVLGAQVYEQLKSYKSHMRARVIVADESDVPHAWKLRLVGAHNRYNVGIAVATARAYGVEFETIRATVEAFEPLPGRLQYVRDVSGVPVYNDTNATTPDATIASLYALDHDHNRRIILIAGGVDKGLAVEALVSAIHDTCKHVVLLPGSGTDKLVAACELTSATCTKVETLTEAVQNVWLVANKGDIVLFSPGFASHNLFQNEYDRGEQFLRLINLQ
jgi:UDP-N-acetylmuramoylalanine--D-glutamate ligase